MAIHLVVNGRTLRADQFPPQTTLLDFLRAQGLTGAKEGCAEGECGACTVVMVRPNGAGAAYVPVNSCLLFLPMCAGQEIWTVEALADGGALAPAQQAMVANAGSQCGYCTPGLCDEPLRRAVSRAAACDSHALSGNLCRCTGYRPIADAARSLGAPPAGRVARPHGQRPRPQWPPRSAMVSRAPPHSPTASASSTQHPGARLIAGGTDLAVESNLRLRRYPYLISLEALDDLRAFTRIGRRLRNRRRPNSQRHRPPASRLDRLA